MVWKLGRQAVHKSITVARVTAAVEADDSVGFCQACGKQAENVEPDARSYVCDSCNEQAVHGAEEYLMELAE